MEIRHKPLAGLSTTERNMCKSLNYRYGGFMREQLISLKHSYDAKAILAVEGDRLTGWALLVPLKMIPKGHFLHTNSYAKKVSKYGVQVYVRKSARGKGVASTLMEQTLKYDQRPTGWPHSLESALLYRKYDMYIPKTHDSLVRRLKKDRYGS